MAGADLLADADAPETNLGNGTGADLAAGFSSKRFCKLKASREIEKRGRICRYMIAGVHTHTHPISVYIHTHIYIYIIISYV